MELATLFWFWMTPVVYAPALVYQKFLNHHLPFALYLLNPMTAVVLAFQRAFYKTINPLYTDPRTHNVSHVPVLVNFNLVWYLKWFGILAVVGLVLIWIGFAVFGRGEGNFAEEL
jgi:ABC-type polysaccharide/polyol phosphate export permease